MAHAIDADSGLLAEVDAGILWVAGSLRWSRVALPAVAAAAGVGCVAIANAMARQGASNASALWWLGLIAIFAPAAATLLLVRLSRTEAVCILVIVGTALYAVKLLYAPGALWGYDELLHYRTVSDILATGRLFSENTLLPVSPYYPGMEAVTAVLAQLTGLTITQAGLVLIGVSRLLLVVSLFLLFERVATPSWLAAPATLLYMASPSFLYFDAMYSYESLAIALAITCLFALRAAQLSKPPRRGWLNVIGALLMLGVVVTHHVTSFLLAGALVVWTTAELVAAVRARRAREAAADDHQRARERLRIDELPGSLWVPLLSVLAVIVWLTNIAEITIGYLLPQLTSGLSEVMRLIMFEQGGRQLFQSSAGHSSSLLERVVGLGSVLVILVLIPLGIRFVWQQRRSDLLSRSLALCALAYPLTLALRLTQSGWDVGSRATAFVYVPLAFTMAAGLELLISRYAPRHERLGAVAIVIAASIVFTGGIIAGSSPITRQPAPYNPGVAEVPYDLESLAAANWAATHLGPGDRFAADSAQGALIGSVGRQRLVTSEDGVSISALFVTPGFDANERSIVHNGHIDYVLVDRRIVGVEPLKGFFYEKWEKQIRDYGSSLTSDTVNKFGLLREASKQFDGGDIEFYEMHRLTP